MRFYFAYGSNMAPAAMARRCPGARLLGPAVLAQHRFAIVRGGHGTVRPKARASVHGVLWRIGRSGEAALDRYEEVARGLYRRKMRLVAFGGRRVSALVYVAAAKARGRPRPAYLRAIVATARGMGFPADYVASLSAIARTASGARPL
jgi:gamma-glutamylcyclotransferase (GGCT)/AIG2-like uncharacterized protein YtfP